MSTRKSILYVLQQPPYLDNRVFEAFDALLVAAAFDQNVSLLFRGAGVTQLLEQQDPHQQRNLSKILRSLETYEITKVFVDSVALESAGLSAADCAIPPTLVSHDEISDLINAQHIVLND